MTLHPNTRRLVTADESPGDRAFRETYLHQCAAAGCLWWIAKGFTVCEPHWLSIPVQEREVIAQGFRVRTQCPDVYQLAVRRTIALCGAA